MHYFNSTTTQIQATWALLNHFYNPFFILSNKLNCSINFIKHEIPLRVCLACQHLNLGMEIIFAKINSQNVMDARFQSNV